MSYFVELNITVPTAALKKKRPADVVLPKGGWSGLRDAELDAVRFAS